MANKIFENIWKIMKENNFQLINEISNKLLCNICNKLMVKACNVPCGCKYCFDCIGNYLDGKDKFCPGKEKFCQIKMIDFEKDIFINYPVNINIAGIVVKCPNKNCEFTDELSLIENHMRTCDKNPTSCPYFEMGCKNDEVINDEMKDHLSTEIHCHTKLLLDFINNLRNEMESMKNDIVELKLENKNLKNELDEIKIGSKISQMRKDIENKIRKYLSDIENLNEEIVVIKNENRSLMNKLENIENSHNEIESMKSDIAELHSENKNLKQDLNKIKIESQNNQMKNEDFTRKIESENRSLMNKLEDIEKSRINEVIESMQRKLEQQTREIDEMKENCKQAENKEIEMRKIIDEIFDKNADLMKKSNIDYDEKINNLQIKIIEMEKIKEKMKFGEFEWKIENLSQQQREINIYSESFYSHKNGYKMCLSVRIEGDYYVNVYFYLMKGEFDNDLLWPFKHAITIDIINQMNGRIDTSKTIKYNDYPNNKGWYKPLTERNNPIVFHIIIKSKEIIRNNQMLIKCKIKF